MGHWPRSPAHPAWRPSASSRASPSSPCSTTSSSICTWPVPPVWRRGRTAAEVAAAVAAAAPLVAPDGGGRAARRRRRHQQRPKTKLPSRRLSRRHQRPRQQRRPLRGASRRRRHRTFCCRLSTDCIECTQLTTFKTVVRIERVRWVVVWRHVTRCSGGPPRHRWCWGGARWASVLPTRWTAGHRTHPGGVRAEAANASSLSTPRGR